MYKTNKVELLSPVGSVESLYAAVNNGCDAVYLGGESFSARQHAANFSLEEIEKACDYCHLRGVKVYVTVNTIYKDKELTPFLDFVKALYEMGVDALIVQDLGATKLIKANFSDFPIHASTQLTANNLSDVEFLHTNGFQKVVLSRELSLVEIENIAKKTEAQIETFVHGALCVCYSGQCIMSSMLGGRSGNRGRCAQTCRLPYTLYQEYDKIEEGHLLSPKDIAAIAILPNLIESGISSFKIEGRMKNPEYVAGVTQIYRKYIDLYYESPENYKVLDSDVKILLQLFNRGGFSEGYYNSFSGSDMMSIERPKTWGLKTGIVDSYNDKQGRVTIRTREPLIPGDGVEIWTQKEPHVGSNVSRVSKAGEVINFPILGDISKNDVVYKTYDKILTDTLRKTWEKHTRKKCIFGILKVSVGEPMTMRLWDNDGAEIFVSGKIVEIAQTNATSHEKIKQQASKMGATPFVLENLDVQITGDVYVPVSDINELRRLASDSLENVVIEKSKRDIEILSLLPSVVQQPYISRKLVNALVNTKEQLDAVCLCENVNILYFEVCEEFKKTMQESIDLCHEAEIKIYAALPRIDREYTRDIYGEFIENLKESNIDGFLVRSSGQFEEVKNTDKKVAVDYNMNTFNNQAVKFWQEAGADLICVSPECNLTEINGMANSGCEMLVYGYMPLMTTHQCPIGAFDGNKTSGMFCSKKGSDALYFLKDRKGEKFPLMTDCNLCVCTILNGQPLFTLKFYNEIMDSTTGSIRLLFTKEGPKRTERVLRSYLEMTNDYKNPSVETKILLSEMAEKGSTRGLFFRSVE